MESNSLKPTDNKIESVEKLKFMYSALFVTNVEELLSLLPPKHSKIFAHHSTIEFKPKSLDGIEIGKTSTLKILGRATDEKGDAILVENPKSKNKFPHITLSCAEGVSPVYSNELLEKASQNGTLELFPNPIEIQTVEGYSDGKNDHTTSYIV